MATKINLETNIERFYHYLCMLLKNESFQEEAKSNGGFFREHHKITTDLNISRKTQYNITKQLVELGFLKIGKRRMGRKISKTFTILTPDYPSNYPSNYPSHIYTEKLIYIYTSFFPHSSERIAVTGKGRKLRRSSKLRSKLKQTTVDNSRWVDYIFDHWCSKGKPLTAHQRGTDLYEKIVNQIKKALKLHNRKEITQRIDTYFWLLTATDLKSRVPFKPAGLIVSLAEFFYFSAETKGRPGFTFDGIESWFDECGKSRGDLIGKYYRGNLKLAKQLSKAIRQQTGIEPSIVKMMQVSGRYMQIINKYKTRLRKNTNPFLDFIQIIRIAEFEDMKYIGQREYDAFEEKIRTTMLVKSTPEPETIMRKLVRSSEDHTYTPTWEK